MSKLAMSNRQIEDFLMAGRVMRLATISESGWPHVVPIWYLYENSRLYIETGADSVKVRNIRRNPHVAICVDVGRDYYDLKNVVMRCRGRIMKNRGLARRIKEKIMVKYLGSLDHPVAKEIMGFDGCVVEFTPIGKKFSQDYSKLE
jgi:general stress protein 26